MSLLPAMNVSIPILTLFVHMMYSVQCTNRSAALRMCFCNDVQYFNTLYTLKSFNIKMSRNMRFPTMWYVRPAKAQTGLRIRAACSEPLLVVEYSMTVKLLVEQPLEFLSLKIGCRGLSESTLVKMPHCTKSHAEAQMHLIAIRFALIIHGKGK